MSRPRRTEEARQKLTVFYAKHGVMPSIEEFAELMEYRSVASAHDLAKALVEEGFLSQTGRANRLAPGKALDTAALHHPIPAVLSDELPDGVPLRVVGASGELGPGRGILEGDQLVLAPPDRDDLGSLLLLSRGDRQLLSDTERVGWKTEGVVLALFRLYRP